jgi:hypothetical protein
MAMAMRVASNEEGKAIKGTRVVGKCVDIPIFLRDKGVGTGYGSLCQDPPKSRFQNPYSDRPLIYLL